VDVVDGEMESSAFTPQEKRNLERQRHLAKVYREGGPEALRKELEALEKESPGTRSETERPATR
jgi:hypothetical protein